MKALILLVVICLQSAFAQTTPDVVVKKSTGVVKHSAYQSIYKHNYDYLGQVLSAYLGKHGCIFNLEFKGLKQEGVFSKGEFIGSFTASCYNKNIKDINLFFEVYPYDEETNAIIEIVDMKGASIKDTACWKHSGSQLNCDYLYDLERSKYNFK